MKKRLSIIHINTHDLEGGAAKVAWRLAEGQSASGHDAVMLVGHKNSSSDLATPFPIDIDHSLRDRRRQEGLLDYELRGSHRLVDNPVFRRADVIHLHNLHGGYFNPFSLPLISQEKPVLWSLHDLQAFTGHCAFSYECERWRTGCGDCRDLNSYPRVEKDATARLWADKREIYARSDMTLVALCQWQKSLMEASILGDKPIELIYNGIDTQVYRPFDKGAVRRRYGIPQDRLVIGCVAKGGSFGDPRKGGPYVEAAIKALRSHLPNLFFVNIGGDAASKETDLNTGHIGDEGEMARLLSAMDMYIFTSLAEICPLVIIEAMACGVPVVSFATGGIPEQVRDGVDGFIVEYKDLDGLIKRMKELAERPDLRRSFSRSSRERAVAAFDHKIAESRYEQLYYRSLEAFQAKRTRVASGGKGWGPEAPSVLLLYRSGENAPEASPTLESLRKQSYPNKTVVAIGNGDVDVSRFDADLVCVVEEGYLADRYWLEMMVDGYDGEDALFCGLRPLKQEGTRFYADIYPIQACDGRLIVYEWLPACVIVKKEHASFLVQGPAGLTGQRGWKTRCVGAGLLALSLDRYMAALLDKHQGKELWVYGAGAHTVYLFAQVRRLEERVTALIDRDPANQGKRMGKASVMGPEALPLLAEKDATVLLSSASYESEIYDRLMEMGLPPRQVQRIYYPLGASCR
ncbi:glycosyltransferase [Heliobacterium undosum]|uniref:Glycosyltransferase n=1 Tax=Heliomicrobium undosum TaxID=121734 RepID=A0A845KZF2_9FIRM|nr:glycosyltransferase [Heliomicrobium undosum]MZP29452.1 glycosyltransferase [Heliomicrobium undosum]